jgi:opacity protein-like surface antigen
VDETEFGAAIAQLGVGLTDPVAPGRWYDGNLALVGELPFLIESEPRHGFAWGGALLLRWSFLALARGAPFLEVGAGILDLDFDVLGRSDGLNFSFQGGGGLEWPLSERISLTALFRYHHISNGGIESRNVALDSALFLAGIAFRPGWKLW